LEKYENDWKLLSPVVLKLTKLVKFFSTEDLVALAYVKVDFEDFTKSQLHTNNLQRNQLGALQKQVS
jgi:hypothetical protein